MERIISAFISMRSSGLIVFTVANVPTGINIGVSNEPWGVWTIPLLAPVCLHVFSNSYVIGMHLFIPSLIRYFFTLMERIDPLHAYKVVKIGLKLAVYDLDEGRMSIASPKLKNRYL